MTPARPSVTAITVTKRARTADVLLSLRRQQATRMQLEHLVVVDDDNETRSAWMEAGGASRVSLIQRESHEVDGPRRLGVLRNAAVSMVDTDYVVFLDDDNRWQRGHLDTLVEFVVERRCSIAHSERLMWTSDWRPYLEPEFPWRRSRAERRALFAEYVSIGVAERGSQRWRDRTSMPASCVDLGEWLMPRDLVLEAFEESPDPTGWERMVVEDHGLERRLVASGLTIASTGIPTLDYRLGGFSNNTDVEQGQWRVS